MKTKTVTGNSIHKIHRHPSGGQPFPNPHWNPTMKNKTTHRARLPQWSAGLAAGAMLLATAAGPDARACDSCNYAFMNEVLTTRADTPAGRDMLAAMTNQAKLPLQGLSNIPHGTPDEMKAFLGGNGNGGESWAESRNKDPLHNEGDFIDIIERDYSLPVAPTSYVPQDATPDKSFTITLHEGQVYLGNGVVYDGFLTDGKVPGPTIIVDEGDIVEFIVQNEGNIPHGASIHAAYTQTSKYLGNIPPGQSKKVLFRANHPGVYMYHCAPGGHAIPMHVLFGQYGMMVVRPTQTQYKMEEMLGRGPDVDIYLVQHEWYASGKDAIEGNPIYTTFNGKLFRYIEEPIMAKPGDYVRIHFLNIGPNLLSTFHLVGIIWDYAYWQGHPENRLVGGQTVTAGPSDSWVIEFRVPPDEGTYLMLSHAVGSTSRGAIGALVADRNAETPVVVKADGPELSKEEMEEIASNAQRVISPFRPGTSDIDPVAVYGPETKEVRVSIIGNSYYPKTVQVAPGTTVTWVNEDVFSYMAGEFSGIHNAVSTTGPERFVSPLLAHAERYSFTFSEEGEYDYICTPHPYMEGRVIVEAPPKAEEEEPVKTSGTPFWLILLVIASLGMGLIAIVKGRR